MKIKNLFFDSTKKKVNLDKRVIIFFFCLLLSISFWFLTALSKDYTTNLSIPLSYTKMSDDFLLVEEPPKLLQIRVSGNGFDLLGEQMSLNHSEVEVNLNFARPMSDGLYAISTDRLQNSVLETLDKDLVLIQIITDSLLLKTQERVSKILPVKLNLDIEYKAGFSLRGELIVQPEKVKVSGPKNEIDSLEFIETQQVNTKDISDTTTLTVSFDDKYLKRKVNVESEEVEVIIPVEKFTEKVFNLGVEIVSVNEGVSIRTFPKQIKAVFIVPLSQYEGFNENLLSAEVNYTKEEIEQKKLKVYLTGMPKYAKLLRIEPEFVEFIIKK